MYNQANPQGGQPDFSGMGGGNMGGAPDDGTINADFTEN